MVDQVPHRLLGKRALVTGAGSGIGRAAALRLAEEGASVGVIDVRSDAVKQLSHDLAATGRNAVGAPADVTDEHELGLAIDRIADQLGGLDLVVASAGVSMNSPTASMAIDDWNRVLGINLTGAFLTVKHALPHLIAAGGGAIVTIGSVASLVAASASSAYEASKGGIAQFTRAVAIEYVDHGIRANCVCPGIIRTDLAANSRAVLSERVDDRTRDDAPRHRVRIPMDRTAEPNEVAAAIAFLCSDDASFVTGISLPVDGGYTAI